MPRASSFLGQALGQSFSVRDRAAVSWHRVPELLGSDQGDRRPHCAVFDRDVSQRGGLALQSPTHRPGPPGSPTRIRRSCLSHHRPGRRLQRMGLCPNPSAWIHRQARRPLAHQTTAVQQSATGHATTRPVAQDTPDSRPRGHDNASTSIRWASASWAQYRQPKTERSVRRKNRPGPSASSGDRS